MWAIEALLALLLIPAGLGVPLYLAIVLGLSLRFGPTALVVSTGLGLAAWFALTLQLVLLPMLHCLDACGDGSKTAFALALYIPASTVLGLAIWWHQRSRTRGRSSPELAHGMHAER